MEEEQVEAEKKRKEAEEERKAALVLAKYQRKKAEKKEAEKAVFQKCEDVNVELCKVTAKVQWETKAKAKKEVTVRAESEKVEGLRKCGQDEGETVGSYLTEHGTQWMVKEGVVCDSCEKKEKKCFWRMEAGWGKPCLACHDLKNSCVAGRAELSEVEAGLSKQRKVEEKGKGKAKVRTPVSRVVESVMVDVF